VRIIANIKSSGEGWQREYDDINKINVSYLSSTRGKEVKICYAKLAEDSSGY
jgi:hypothetical protein